jgi:hypothetical protein
MDRALCSRNSFLVHKRDLILRQFLSALVCASGASTYNSGVYRVYLISEIIR